MLHTYDFNHFLLFYSFTYFIEYCNDITLKSQDYLESNKVIIIIILPPHLLAMLKLWFNFIFGLNFFLFQTHLGSMGNCLSRKAEMPTSVVDSGDSPFFTFPLPPLSTAPLPQPPLLHPAPNWPSHLRELCEVLHEVNAIKTHPSWIQTLTHVQPIIAESNSKLIVLLNNWVTQQI